MASQSVGITVAKIAAVLVAVAVVGYYVFVEQRNANTSAAPNSLNVEATKTKASPHSPYAGSGPKAPSSTATCQMCCAPLPLLCPPSL